MKDKQKPCPFCGNDAGEMREHRGYFYLRCIACGASGGKGKTVKEAISIWNKRKGGK
jgi:Lar family restriction alleviation protein